MFHKNKLYWALVIIIAFVCIQTLVSLNILNEVYKTVLINIGINILLAISLNLIIGITGQFSLGHAGFVAIGAYAYGVVNKSIGGPYAIYIGMAVAMGICAVVAFAVALPTLRLKGDYLAIATLGFGEVIRIVIQNLKITNGASGMVIPKSVDWPLVFIVLAASTLMLLNFTRSAYGRACISIREDEIASEMMGIALTKYKVLAFVLGAVIASLGGVLYAGSFYIIKPEIFNFNKSIDILVIVVFGGMGSFTGSYIAAFVIGILNTILQNFAGIRTILYGVLLVLIMIFRPKGLLGTVEFSFANLQKSRKEGRL
ncbi:MAG: branched-chain amino acid ABC transporter permease [Eubacteriales bacterium]|nr:branched-chain amino acid ABC transporter permease [Eubacteriales bacterium]